MADPATAVEGGIGHLHDSFRRRRLSPVEVAAAYLARIADLNETVHAYLLVTGELALDQARRAESRFAAGEPLGLLDGIPVAVKDVYDTNGIRTTGHSAAFADRVPTRDAAAVERLGRAGAVLLGKLALTELGAGVPSPGDIPPPARNPWDPGLAPGGSSSGPAAAVAAGLCVAALGTDTGGSIRDPASCCGVTGMKPTYDLVSRDGCIPLSPSLDHCGPLARSAGDCAAVLAAIADRPVGRSAAGAEGVRIGVPGTLVDAVEPLDDEVAAAFAAALASLGALGAIVTEVDLPDIEHEPAVYSTTLGVEMLALHGERATAHAEGHTRPFLRRLVAATALTDADLEVARRGRRLVTAGVDRAMTNVDLLALPTRERPAQPFGATSGAWLRPSLRHPFNVTGQPAISIPCGFTTSGLPIGMQLVGRRDEDGLVLAVAAAYEQAHDWTSRRPVLAP